MSQMRHAPAAERNREPILSVLRRVLPSSGTVLEIASGSGQHVAHFAQALPALVWQPSEFDREAHASIDARTAGLPNVRPVVALDATSPVWGLPVYDAIFNANMIHIAPWEACAGMMRGAGEHLRPDGVLVLYGPFRRDGQHTAPSNAAFDASLRQRDPRWGVRDIEAVTRLAADQQLILHERVEMPANNQMLLFRRS
jgi:cyclopropane fatty-acyl-phospholipid synthase-like methyltransferase